MNSLNHAFSSGRIIDFILCVVVVEILVLGVYWHRTGRGVAPKSLMAMLGAGACLLMTIKAVLVQAGVASIAFWLTTSLVFHLLDLYWRWNHSEWSGTGSKP